tara:strand:+ start:534 stop:728 length:195 start_codon:yes stop_codon:yes gene_type:complete
MHQKDKAHRQILVVNEIGLYIYVSSISSLRSTQNQTEATISMGEISEINWPNWLSLLRNRICMA